VAGLAAVQARVASTFNQATEAQMITIDIPKEGQRPRIKSEVATEWLTAQAEGLMFLVAHERKSKPWPCMVRFPGTECWGLRIDNAAKALATVRWLLDAAARYDAAEQAMRRKAGMSPVSEEIELVTDAEGMPVLAKKKLRY